MPAEFLLTQEQPSLAHVAHPLFDFGHKSNQNQRADKQRDYNIAEEPPVVNHAEVA
jgi:hypothetical protein